MPKSKVIAYSNLTEQQESAAPASGGLEYDYYSSFAAYASNPTLLYEAMKSYYGNTYDEATIQQMTAYYLQYFASMSGAAPANTETVSREEHDDVHDRRRDSSRKPSASTLNSDRYRSRDEASDRYDSRSNRREYSPDGHSRDDDRGESRRARDPRSRSSRDSR